jgi:homoserine O-acetyltransferase
MSPIPCPARTLRIEGPFRLESGAELPEVEIAWQSWGELDPVGGNAVLVCHALTGSPAVDAWWPGLFGPGRTLDPRRDFILCANVLGGCYGSTGPASRRPGGERWGADFPAISIRDMVRLQARLLEELGIERLRLVIGGSMGGMLALEWPLLYPDKVDAVAAIATSARHSAWCIGISEAQRQAIFADPAWQGGRYEESEPPAAGLAAARAVAMVSYRSRQSFEQRFARDEGQVRDFAVESYLAHQGKKLVERFDAGSYVTLTRAMDSHDLGRGRGGVRAALGGIAQPVLVVAITSDVLYPPAEQEELAGLLPHGELAYLDSPHGHDAFLIDADLLDPIVRSFRDRRELLAAA